MAISEQLKRRRLALGLTMQNLVDRLGDELRPNVKTKFLLGLRNFSPRSFSPRQRQGLVRYK